MVAFVLLLVDTGTFFPLVIIRGNPHNWFQSLEEEFLTHVNGPTVKLGIENRKELLDVDLLKYTPEKKENCSVRPMKFNTCYLENTTHEHMHSHK